MKMVHFVESSRDREREVAKEGVLEDEVGIRCAMCESNSVFATNRAFLMHQRMKHGVKICARLYVNEDAVCPGCGTCFRQRLRCIAHLQDARRGQCNRKMINGEFPRLDDELVVQLDARDCELRRLAKRAGRTTPIAVGCATTSCGKKVGFAKH